MAFFDRLLQRSVDVLPWALRTRIGRLPLIAPLQRHIVTRLLANRPFIHEITAGPAKGVRFPVRLPDDKMVWTGTLEEHFASQLREAVTDGSVCVDVGSHRGYMAGVMAAAGASVVHCIDPNPENAARIRQVIELNPRLRFEVHELALADTDGREDFVLMPSADMGKLSRSEFQASRANEGVTTVQVHRLDTLVAEGVIPPPQVVKIDVEGAEVAVLDGARDVIKRYHPTLFIEFHTPDLRRRCEELLATYGYQVAPIQDSSGRDRCPGHLKAIPPGS